MVDFKDDPDFVALDQDYFGDGDTDQTTRPLSTYGENRIDGNNRALLQTNNQVTWQPRSNPNRGNVYASTQWTRFYLFPLIIGHEADSITARVDATFGTRVTDPEVDLKMTLLERAGAGVAGSFGRLQGTSRTFANNVASFPHEMSVDVTEANTNTATADKLIWVAIDYRSAKEPSTPHSVGFASTVDAIRTPAGLSLYSVQNFQGVSEFNLAQSYLTLLSDVPEEDWDYNLDILGVSTEDDASEEWILVSYRYVNLTQIVNTLSDQNPVRFDFTYLSSIRPKNVSLDVSYDSSIESARWADKSDRSKGAKKVLRGHETATQGSNANRNYTRWRPVVQGPTSRGTIDSTDAPWDDIDGRDAMPDWYERYAHGFDSTFSTDEIVGQSTFMADFDEVDVRVDGLLFGHYIQRPWRFIAYSDSIRAEDELRDPEDDELYLEWEAQCNALWSIDQMSTGDTSWSAVRSGNIRRAIPLWKYALINQRPLQRIIGARHLNNIDDFFEESDYEKTPQQIFGYHQLRNMHEGETAHEHRLLTPFTISMTLDSSEFNASKPLRFRLQDFNVFIDAAEGSGPYLDPWTGESYAASGLDPPNPDRTQVDLVSYTISIRGRL